MLPAFHRESIAAAHTTMLSECERAIATELPPGARVDLYTWTRHLAMRIALRALFGIDPDGEAARSIDAAELFESALGFYGKEYALQALRGPFTPWARMHKARRRLDWLIYSEVARRRRSGERGLDLLSLLLDARDEDGASLTPRQIRDEVMTLLFAGHDTTTSTISFMFYELARHPQWTQTLLAEQTERLGERTPTPQELDGATLPNLEMVIDETLRLYPPAWVGPRRSREPFSVCGVPVPGGVPVDYSSWVSHRLPDVWPEPNAFRPERFAPAAKAALPKGAYIPFGGGSRTCIGMRFGQLEVRTIATMLLAARSFELDPGYTLRIRQMPTISPRDGLPVLVREPHASAAAGILAAAA
jgi:cytochrome P450